MAAPHEPNKDGEVKDKFSFCGNEGTTKLPDDKTAEDGEETMPEKPEEVELKSMFPTDM